ncbi:MAG: YbaB/EbfC family nucleoid-associated protein [Candidatus Omnitrophica bacterium]|jgi:DNA-binding protein YbaB|nr:YbaB/EbfC family nucleoid-associated protein [Candidatus Omnitrophota bacterium]
MFDKMKQMMDLQKKVQELKKQLEQATFEVSSSDGVFKVVMNAAQEIKDVILADSYSKVDKGKLEQAIKDTYNRAIKRAQEIAASKMKDISGLALPGF